MYGTRVPGHPVQGGSHLRFSGVEPEHRVQLRKAAFLCRFAPTLRQVNIQKWRVRERVVNREVLISAMPDSPSNPPHFLSPLRNLLNPTVPTRSDMKISLKHFVGWVGGFRKISPSMSLWPPPSSCSMAGRL